MSVDDTAVERMEKQPPATISADVQIEDSGKEIKKKKAMECCKKVMGVVGSHLGLGLVVALYTGLGGIIFEHLETTNEKNTCIETFNKYVEAENDTLSRLWEMNIQNLEEFDTKTAFKKVLEKFRDRTVSIGYDGTNCSRMGEDGGTAFKWSFSGSLMFAVTVITTVGKLEYYQVLPLYKMWVFVRAS
jgi:hypothetical protein